MQESELNENLLNYSFAENPSSHRDSDPEQRLGFYQNLRTGLANSLNANSLSLRNQFSQSEVIWGRVTEWDEEEVMERNLVIQEGMMNTSVDGEALDQGEDQQKSPILKINTLRLHQHSLFEAGEGNSEEINMRLYTLRKQVANFLYYFNLVFNSIFRLGLLSVLLLHYFGAKHNLMPIIALISLEWACVVLYFVAIVKMLFTKNDQISIYFQKEFEKDTPYSQIRMRKLFRNHFTLHNLAKNLQNYISPFSDFNRNVKISLIRQQIFKRMEIVLVFLPLFCCYNLDLPWLLTNENSIEMELKKMYAVVMLFEVIRITIHYLIIYIFT